MTLHGVIASEQCSLVSRYQQGTPMDRYIHRENLRLFRKRLENQSLSETERKTILMLLADEQAKRPRFCDTVHELRPVHSTHQIEEFLVTVFSPARMPQITASTHSVVPVTRGI
jgi:hypothetical protein